MWRPCCPSVGCCCFASLAPGDDEQHDARRRGERDDDGVRKQREPQRPRWPGRAAGRVGPAFAFEGLRQRLDDVLVEALARSSPTARRVVRGARAACGAADGRCGSTRGTTHASLSACSWPCSSPLRVAARAGRDKVGPSSRRRIFVDRPAEQTRDMSLREAESRGDVGLRAVAEEEEQHDPPLAVVQTARRARDGGAVEEDVVQRLVPARAISSPIGSTGGGTPAARAGAGARSTLGRAGDAGSRPRRSAPGTRAVRRATDRTGRPLARGRALRPGRGRRAVRHGRHTVAPHCAPAAGGPRSGDAARPVQRSLLDRNHRSEKKERHLRKISYRDRV